MKAGGVAVVGYGLAGEAFHAPLVAATPGLRLAAVVTTDVERTRRARQRYPGVEVVGAAGELWRRAAELGVDLAVLATPNRTHVPLARAALDAGLPVAVRSIRRTRCGCWRSSSVVSAPHGKRSKREPSSAARLLLSVPPLPPSPPAPAPRSRSPG